MVSAQMKSVIDQFLAAFNSLDIDKLMDTVSDANVDFHDLGVDKHFTKKADIKAHYEEIFQCISNPKMNIEAVSGNDTDFTATEWTFSFNYTKQSPLLPIPAEGQEIKMLGCNLNWFGSDGKVVKSRNYTKFLLPPPGQ